VWDELASRRQQANLRYIATITDIARCLLGLCVWLASIIFLKFLRFNKTCAYFFLVFKKCMRELFSYAFMLVLVFVSITQLLYLFFYQHSIKYSNLLDSLPSSCLISLKRYNSNFTLSIGTFLGPLSLVVANVLLVFVFVNLILVVLVQALARVKKLRQRMLEKSDDLKLMSHLGQLIRSRFARSNRVGLAGEKPKLDNMIELSLRLNKVSAFLRNVSFIYLFG
jgi:hypothetical protein